MCDGLIASIRLNEVDMCGYILSPKKSPKKSLHLEHINAPLSDLSWKSESRGLSGGAFCIRLLKWCLCTDEIDNKMNLNQNHWTLKLLEVLNFTPSTKICASHLLVLAVFFLF